MRILMISDVYFPRVNGVSTSIKTFIDELVEQGHHVTLIAPEYGVDDAEVDAKVCAKVLRIASRKIVFDPEDRLMRRRELLKHLPVLADDDYDVMHIHTPFMAHYAGITVARRLGIPAVETYHTYFEEYLHHYMRFMPRKWLRYAARRFSHSQSEAINAMVVPSTLMRDVLLDYKIATPLHIIPTGIEQAWFERGFGDLFRAKHGISLQRPVLCHVGRAAHEKNIDFLLDMLAVVKQRVPDILLVIAGEGPAVPHLKHRVHDEALSANVQFIGYLDRATELKDCYCAADVFVFASRTETQGLVLLEAMAQAVPVVSTAILGTVDILRPQLGALVAADEVNDFAANVVRMIEDMALREQKQLEAVAYVSSWSAAEQAAKLVMLYREVIHNHESAAALQQANNIA